ncbi:MAG: diguanylate cyclase [Opitutaceae bacterium]|nr:diguanylate cyclase [Opitutaceae bacterium]MBP9911923.1 diguanylate cyclase [Opitutaceae bacterium]
MTRKILLIDDDRMQFRLAQQYFKAFRSSAFELDWAPTYETGIVKLMSGNYAACLLDYQLGERDGLVLIREAIGRGCRVPIIFLTAESSEKVDIEAMNSGALDYLVKGEISSRTLERSLRYALKLGDTLEALRLLATRDQLTNLLNRREFERILGEEKDRALRFANSFALILLDIDHFKRVNDQHGHPAGDEVLRKLARRFESGVRSVDRVARIGGEEFAIVMVEADQNVALEIMRRLCAAIERTPVHVSEGLDLPMTVSMGVAIFPHDTAAGLDLVAAADKALYAAKTGGRNRVVLFSDLKV